MAFSIRQTLRTDTFTIRDVVCDGHTCRNDEECAHATHIAFPYRGVYVRRLGRDETVAEANQALFFNRGESYRVSHPVCGGDSNLVLATVADVLRELAPARHLRDGGGMPAFRRQSQRIDASAQATVALLHHGLDHMEPLHAETLALTLLRRTLGERSIGTAGAGPRRLVERSKLALAADPARRWKLAEIAREVGASPVYLTQAFRQVEAMPLYRYQLQLRLARALDLLAGYDDLAALGLDLGFSSHSHFSSAFRRAYGRTPAEFRRAMRASRVVAAGR